MITEEDIIRALERLDVVVSDIEMPGIKGLQLLGKNQEIPPGEK